MSKFDRKIKRQKEKEQKKNQEAEMKQKIHMFGQLPDNCLTCNKEFDKTDKSMVQSWCVVIREDEKKVNLYCPECWTMALNVIEEYKKEIEDDGRKNNE